MRARALLLLLIAGCAHAAEDGDALLRWGRPVAPEVRLWLDYSLLWPRHALRIRATSGELVTWWPSDADVRIPCPNRRTGYGVTACVQSLPPDAVAKLNAELRAFREPAPPQPGPFTVTADGDGIDIERCANRQCRRKWYAADEVRIAAAAKEIADAHAPHMTIASLIEPALLADGKPVGSLQSFLDLLREKKSAETPVVRVNYVDPRTWLSEADTALLASLLDSNEPCAWAVPASQTFVATRRSTIGEEAASLLEGYRTGIYPPLR